LRKGLEDLARAVNAFLAEAARALDKPMPIVPLALDP
jgi:hypothetical protein